jgi:hypothetical protein
VRWLSTRQMPVHNLPLALEFFVPRQLLRVSSDKHTQKDQIIARAYYITQIYRKQFTVFFFKANQKCLYINNIELKKVVENMMKEILMIFSMTDKKKQKKQNLS